MNNVTRKTVPEIRYDMNSADFLKLDLDSAEALVNFSIVWQYRTAKIRFAGAGGLPDFFEHTICDTYANDWK